MRCTICIIPEENGMKRIIALSLCLLLVAVLAACKQKEPANQENTYYMEAPVTNPAYTETGTIPVPAGSVTIRLPLAFLNKEQKDNLPGWADAHGIYSAEINEDKGIATLVMSDLSHKLLLTSVGLDVIEALYGFLDDGLFPYFKGIETYDSKDFSELVILVDGNAYMMDPDADLLPQTLAQTCMIYQGYTNESQYHCRVLVKDEATGGAVRDETYKQTSKDLKQ